MNKPPIGVQPDWCYWAHHPMNITYIDARIEDILRATKDYVKFGDISPVLEWLEELTFLIERRKKLS